MFLHSYHPQSYTIYQSSIIPTLQPDKLQNHAYIQIIEKQKMNEIHNDYLKDQHLQDEDEQELNIHSHPTYQQQTQTPDQQLQGVIFDHVVQQERKEDTISAELEQKLDQLMAKIDSGEHSEQELVRLRMNELALNKILVYTHGKSQFRLVAAHHHMGKAYLVYKCYEQAIDHLTLALKKNSKLTDLKESKLYHSMVLTTLSKCYFQIGSYDDALQVLTRALDIQVTCYKELGQNDKCYVETYRLTACCHLKMKNYKKANQFIRSAIQYCSSNHGQKSKEVAHLKVELAKISFQQKNYDNAIQELDSAIEILIDLNYKDKKSLIELQDLLALYYDKNGQRDKQIQTFYAKLQLMEQLYDKDDKNILKFKRSIASILIKYQRFKQAIAVLEQILESEEKVYGPNSLHVGKTLKMLGLVFMNTSQTNSAEHYLKRAQKILQDQGNGKLVKQIKSKLSTLKQSKDKKISGMASSK